MAAYTTIDDPEAYFQTVLYAGNGSADHAITLPGDTDMQPDLVWIKNRDAADAHCLYDAVRGATKHIQANDASGEATDTDTLDSFLSDGFQVDADNEVNTSGEDYVAWCWKETADAGFDIVSYTGNATNRTISHSLSAVPHLMIVKNRASSVNWTVYHHKNTSAPETDRLLLNEPDATGDSDAEWNDTAPTSSVFTVGTGNSPNQDGNAIIAYLWSEKQGFSKFGSYVGNGNADGTFIYTGFRPAWILIKQTDASRAWNMYDNKRVLFRAASTGYGFNSGVDMRLYANTTGDEENYASFDFLSNGFKAKTNNAYLNDGTYVYIAFAESPFVNSNGVPNNAR